MISYHTAKDPMDPRDFFTAHHWWGKLIGASLGFLILGPVGGLFGVLIGNLFDRGLTEQFSRPYWQYHAETRASVKKAFFKTTFEIMGHVLKADGRITEEQINAVSQLLTQMQLNKTERKLAQHYFREGKQTHFDLWQSLYSVQEIGKYNPDLIKVFIDLQFKAAQAGNFSPKKLQILNTILSYLGYAPVHQQYRYKDDFKQSHNQTNNNQSSYTNYKASPHETSYAYNLLGVPQTATKQEVQKAYRRLISKHHPDKLIAKNMSEASIKLANEKTQQIRKAYEKICSQKGW